MSFVLELSYAHMAQTEMNMISQKICLYYFSAHIEMFIDNNKRILATPFSMLHGMSVEYWLIRS